MAFVTEVEARWGVRLRPHQLDAVAAVLAGRDVTVTVATGGGKSLVYQAVALYRAPVLVVSPLLSLMHDQTSAARARGLRVSNLSDGDAVDEDTQVVFATPERAVSRLGARAWGAIAVDEAHCVCTWGAHFRPEYARLGELREACSCPLLALTASATPEMVVAIQRSLGMVHPVRVAGTLARPNLTLRVAPKKPAARGGRKYADVQALVHPPCIVYVTKRSEADEISEVLQMFRCAPYHAGMSLRDREQVLELFLAGELCVVVATIAFGMGIDKADVRSVVHYGPSKSVEAYYQEAGRAGRDGEASTCTLLVSPADWTRLRYAGAEPRALRAMEDYASGEVCLHQSLLRYFGEASEPCGRCGVCTAATPVAPAFGADAVVQLVGAHPYFGVSGIAAGLRGDAKAHAKLKKHAAFGVWRNRSSAVVVQNLRSLVRQGVLAERTRSLSSGGTYESLVVPGART